MLSPNLSYRALLKVKRREARDFYEVEAAKHKWSARELKRRIFRVGPTKTPQLSCNRRFGPFLRA